MWAVYALCSAFFAGITAVLAKAGMAGTNSNLVTALRTGVVLVFSWLMVFIVGSQGGIWEISGETMLFLVLSGLSTGASWLCYFKALQLGDINKVVPIDKSSIVLTMLLAFLLLGEGLSTLKMVCVAAIGAGTFLMIEQKNGGNKKNQEKGWLIYAVFSAIFASLTSILGKVGIMGVESNLGTAIRTIVVLVMAWVVVFVTKSQGAIGDLNRKNWLFIVLSGVTTGLSWLCYYRALQDGPASVVVPIDKLSILVSIGFGYVFFQEKISKKALGGLGLIVGGTLLLLV